MSFKGKTIFITGGSRGIGKHIGLRLAKEGANVVIAAKTVEPHPKLPGTIYTAADEMTAAGGQGLGVQMDLRDEDAVQNAIDTCVDKFGGIDVLINNASAISLTPTDKTAMKRYDLMHHINTRGTFLATKLCLPHLKQADNPHILTLSPPLNMDARWFAPHVAYTMAKYGMSMCVLGHSEEFKDDGIAVNALWPRTTIDTAAVRNLLGGQAMVDMSRKPEIMGDAVYHILKRDSKQCTGNFFIDDDVLREEGYTDEQLDAYAVTPGGKLMPDLFL